jgi:ribonuclease HI
MWLVGAYIPPVTSHWQGWTDVDPFEQLWETVALCTQSEDKHVVLLPDINGRITSEQVPSFQDEWPRLSTDTKINTRGRAVLNECDKYGLCILNGTSFETTSPGRFTSWQPGGQSTIDYAIISRSLIPLVKTFHVEEPTPDPEDDWADHTRICLTLDTSSISRSERTTSIQRDLSPDFTGTSPIDTLYQEVMDSRESPDAALSSLWGQVLAESIPTQIYVEGAAPGATQTKSAGAGIFFGPDSLFNRSLKVPGGSTQFHATADRGRIYAIHEAIQKVDSDKTVLIFCTSKMVIRQLCYTAAKNMAIGWSGSNGDLFKATVKLLAARHGRTIFVYLDKKADNESKRGAYALARAALQVPQSATIFLPIPDGIPACNNAHVAFTGKRKVLTELEEKSPQRPSRWRSGEDETSDEIIDPKHCGRAKVHKLQQDLRKELLACKDHESFWDFIRKRTDARPRKAKVTLTQLSSNFEARLNYPAATPASFNAEQLTFNARMARELAFEPPDTSPRQSYTRDITLEEIEEMKLYIKEHGLDTALGVDGFSYKDYLAVPNEKLLEFFLFCLRSEDAP